MKRNYYGEPCKILTTYIPCSMIDSIKEYAELNNQSVSVVVKEAISIFIEKNLNT